MSPAPSVRWAVRAGTGAALLGGSWSVLRSTGGQRADVWAGNLLRCRGAPALDRVVTHTTDLGSLHAVAAMAAVLAAARRRRLATDVLVVGTTAWAVAQTTKQRVLRARPYEAEGVRRLIRPPAGSSFPSGHAAVAMAVMELVGERSPRRWAGPALRASGAYVAASRVYVGVHYPTDVIGGAGLGLLLGAVWRGPVASAGRRLVGLGGTLLRRCGPSVMRVVTGRRRSRG